MRLILHVVRKQESHSKWVFGLISAHLQTGDWERGWGGEVPRQEKQNMRKF